MLPDIRVVVTAIATTVLILVGMGLMASIRINHQGLSGGLMVASAPPEITLGARITWPQKPEQVLSLPHETVDLTAMAEEEKRLADRILARLPEPAPAAPAYALAGEPADKDPQIATLLAREQEVPTGLASSEAIDLTPTASVSTPNPPSPRPKKTAAVPAAAKATAKNPSRPTATARAQGRPITRAARARRGSRVAGANENPLDTPFGLDLLH